MNINSRRSRYLEWAAQLILAIAIAGCSGGASPVAIDATALTHDTPKTVQSDRRDEVLRIRVDMLRGRYWVLGLDYVSVYRIANMHLIRRVVLPGWTEGVISNASGCAECSVGTMRRRQKWAPTYRRVDGFHQRSRIRRALRWIK